MAGGKETPRQKMIGMMYLVLTALLALNVSKEIIAAFVTLDEKLGSSASLIENNTMSTYDGFKMKQLALEATKGDKTTLLYWKGKADKLRKESSGMIGFLNKQCSDMIKQAEKVDWYDPKKDVDEFGNVFRLRSLREVQNMDNYDIPTNTFIGSNPQQPIKAGLDIPKRIHEYRNAVTELMGNYEANGKKFSFKAPDDVSKLTASLKTANPEDTAYLAKIFRSLTIPATLKVKHAGEEVEMPWASVMFDHAPIVAAAAMFTALTVDIKQAEGDIVGFMLSKVEAPTFNFNKIEPMAFARTGYLNSGDTMSLRVMIAAYDSTETPRIVWNGTEYSGPIPIKAGTPGAQKMDGLIYVKERGQEVPKPWSFNYTVGKPSGAVSLPELSVLYRGYQNKVVGAASGYPSYKLVGTNNVTLTQSGQEYIASPGAGREAVISLQGVSPDGKSANLGTFNFRVRNMPKPSIKLGSIQDGDSPDPATVKAQTRIFAGYGDEIPLVANFNVTKYEIVVSGAPRPEGGTGSNLSAGALGLIRQARSGNTITVMTDVVGPDGKSRKSNMSFKVK
jgi:hypothetical protein